LTSARSPIVARVPAPAGPAAGGAVGRLARGSSLAIVGTGLSQLSLFLVVALLAAAVGTDGVGVYTQAYAVLTICLLIALLGMQTTLTRYVAQHLVSGEVTSIRPLVRWGVFLPTTAGCALGIVVFASSDWVAHSLLHEPQLVLPLRMVGVALPPAVYAKAAAAVLQGYSNMRDYVMITLVLEPALRMVLTAAALLIGTGLTGASVALAVSNLVSAGWARHRLRASVPRFTARVSYAWQPLLRFSSVTWVASMATTGLLWADTLIIGHFRSSSDVGIYQVATRLLAVATLASVPIASAFAPRIAELVRTERYPELQSAYSLTTTWATRLAVPLLALCTIAPGQLLNLFGSQYAAAATVTVVLVVGKLVESATGPCGMVLNMSSRVGLNAANNVVALAINIVLNLLLVPRYGLVGAALAWSVALVVVNLARVIEVRIAIGLRLTEPRALRSVLAIVPTALLAVLLRQPLHGLTSLLVQGLVLVLGYAATLRVLDWNDEDAEISRALMHRRRRGTAGADVGASRPPAADPLVAGPVGDAMVGVGEVPGDPADSGTAMTQAGARPGSGDPLLTAWELVSPLRYDILVRAEFFRFIERHEGLYDNERRRFMRKARAHDYFLWHQAVATQHSRWSPRSADKAFARRVDKSVSLLRSFRAEGFDERHPITIWAADKVLPTDTGKHIHRRFFMGDGCHRLALLLNSGTQDLLCDQVQVHRVAVLAPRDNTAKMLAVMTVDRSSYMRFIARGYGLDPDAVLTRDDLLSRLPDPRAAEVEQVVDVDLGLLDARPVATR